MLSKAKEVIVSANSRTKGMIIVACIYVVIMFATVTTSAVEMVENFIPTVNIQFKDGLDEKKEYLVKQDTVGNVLNELEVELDSKDTVNLDIDKVVEENDYIKITRVTTKTVTKVEKLAYKTVKEGAGTWGSTVVQEGQDGKIEKTYLITYANGKELTKKVIDSKIIEEPVNKIIRSDVIQTGTTFTGRLTTYGGDCSGCGGNSSSGLKLSAKTGVNNTNSPFLTYKGKKYYCIAADRSIPFGTVIEISNHNLNLPSKIKAIVVDRGGAIKGKKIDIFKGSENGGKSYFSGGTSTNTKFKIIKMGSGKAYFWQ